MREKCGLYEAHVFVVCFFAGEYEVTAAKCDTILGEKSIHYCFQTTTNVTFAQDQNPNNWLASVDPGFEEHCDAEALKSEDEDEDDGTEGSDDE